jgi:hypothetical protein
VLVNEKKMIFPNPPKDFNYTLSFLCFVFSVVCPFAMVYGLWTSSCAPSRLVSIYVFS